MYDDMGLVANLLAELRIAGFAPETACKIAYDYALAFQSERQGPLGGDVPSECIQRAVMLVSAAKYQAAHIYETRTRPR